MVLVMRISVQRVKGKHQKGNNKPKRIEDGEVLETKVANHELKKTVG